MVRILSLNIIFVAMTGLAHEYYIAPSYEQKNASNDDDDNNDDYHVYEIGNIMYSSVSQPL